ncbi:hypothetical protein C8R44DRAFT_891798 [Mycena epipterygia]|nr:hypothetical protein C8R44DRAFT_891798 [Mycena epipterygia]
MRLVSKTYILPLMYRQLLATWVHPAGTMVLLTDACHHTLSSRAQGSAMADEDAAVLGTLLARITGRAGCYAAGLLGHPVCAHQRDAARPRAGRQHARGDGGGAGLGTQGGVRDAEGSANVWADRKKSQRQFGYNAEADAQRWCTENGFCDSD